MAGGGSQTGSQDTPSKGYSKDSLRPVTIKQLVDATHPHPDADFKVDSVDVTQITFIGQIRNISVQATNITYKLDDGTGLIEIKKWVDQDRAEGEGGQAGSPYVTDQYLRVYGRLKEFSGKRHVGAHSIRQITDFNEITFHLLEAAFVHLNFTRGAPETLTKQEGMFVSQAGLPTRAAAPSYQYDSAGGHLSKNMTPTARRVLTELNNAPQNNEGLHIRQIEQSLGMRNSDVLKGCDELLGMGVIYTTVDDFTFAVLEC